MIYPIIGIQQKAYKKHTICEPRRQISRLGYLQFQL